MGIFYVRPEAWFEESRGIARGPSRSSEAAGTPNGKPSALFSKSDFRPSIDFLTPSKKQALHNLKRLMCLV
jgi:hypothetical protein